MDSIKNMLKYVLVFLLIAAVVTFVGGLVSSTVEGISWFMPALAIAAAIGFALWRIVASQAAAFLENPLAVGVGKSILAILFLTSVVLLISMVHNSERLKIYFDLSPRGMMLASIVVAALILFVIQPFIPWIMPTEGVFARSTVRLTLGALLVTGISFFFLPNDFFKPESGDPIASIDPATKTPYWRDGFSRESGEKLVLMDKKTAKELRFSPWERVKELLKEWMDRKTSKGEMKKEDALVPPKPAPPPPPKSVALLVRDQYSIPQPICEERLGPGLNSGNAVFLQKTREGCGAVRFHTGRNAVAEFSASPCLPGTVKIYPPMGPALLWQEYPGMASAYHHPGYPNRFGKINFRAKFRITGNQNTRDPNLTIWCSS